MKGLGIVVAMAEECASLTGRRPRAGETMPLHDGAILGLCAGTGPQAAGEAAARLLSQGVEALVSWGCSAALDPQLSAGDLLIPERLQAADGTQLYPAAHWRERLLSRLAGQIPCHGGTVQESETIVAAAAEKQERFAATGALALDMESAAVARTALAGQVPFLAIRSIVDPAALSIPDAVQAAFDAQGRLHPARLLGGFLRKPQDIFGTAALGWRFRCAMQTLRRVHSLAGKQLAV